VGRSFGGLDREKWWSIDEIHLCRVVELCLFAASTDAPLFVRMVCLNNIVIDNEMVLNKLGAELHASVT